MLRKTANSLPFVVSDVLKLCIVGAGPAGLYTAERLLKKRGVSPVQIDVLDRLPFPFGLVETGVAPDHPATKNVRNGFRRLLHRTECRFFGNVRLGRDVSVSELKERYHGVVFSCGAEVDRRLGIKGEGGRGVLSAREFVWWYNGHPDCSALDIDLSRVRSVVIVGGGNVALDCARILLKRGETLARTDIAARALQALERSEVRDVHLVIRRNAAGTKFTPKELREILHLPGVSKTISTSDLEISAEEAAAIKGDRLRRRVYGLLDDAARQDPTEQETTRRTLHFRFSRRVQEVRLNSEGAVEGVSLVGEKESDAIDAELVITSIGTRAAPVEGLPYDAARGVVPNRDARVVRPETDTVVAGLYVSGWLRRGATGIIGTNILDAEDVADAVAKDRESLTLQTRESTLAELLSEKGVRWVSLQQWEKLRLLEDRRGKKLVDLAEMLDVCFNDPH